MSVYVYVFLLSCLGGFLFGHSWRHVGSQFPGQRWNLCPLWLKHGFLTSGPPGKSLSVCVLIFHPIFSGLLGVFGGVFCCYCFKLK